MKRYIKAEIKVNQIADVIKVSVGQVTENGITIDYATDVFGL